MTAEVSTIMALIPVIEKIGGWGIGGILAAMFVVPSVFIYLAAKAIAAALGELSRQIAHAENESEKRSISFNQKYDNNFTFIKDYQKMADSLLETLRRNTIAITKLVDRFDVRGGL